MFKHLWLRSILAACLILIPSTECLAQEAPAESRRVVLGVADAVKLATTHNTTLRVSFFNHLIERTRIAEAQGAFEPVGFFNGSYGVNEVAFPQIFPTGTDPQGNPVFQQVIVTDSTTVGNWVGGVRGLLPSGATWDLRINTDYSDRETGGTLNPTYRTTTSANASRSVR